MLEKVAGKTETYKCEKCGHTYLTREKAIFCQSSPVTPFKYEIGDTVICKFQSHIPHAIAWHDRA